MIVEIKTSDNLIEAVRQKLGLSKRTKYRNVFEKKDYNTIIFLYTKNIKENFYLGILLGILGFKGGWTVKSNKEAGDGFSDIMIRIDDSDVGIILEVKYAEEGQMEKECRKALDQIREKNYAENMRLDGVRTILKYGITCNKKKCCVLLEKD